MKKQPINWGHVIGRLLEAGVGRMEGGFLVDENGRLVEDYAQEEAAGKEAYLMQLIQNDELPEEDEDDLFSVFGTMPTDKRSE